MNILLVGGYQQVYLLIESLKAKGHMVAIINEDYGRCEMLSNTYEIISIHGNGTKPSLMEEAGIKEMDMVIALSDLDSTNLIVCEIAKKQYNVKNTVTMVNNPKNIKKFKKLGVSKFICVAQMLSDVIDQETIIENLHSYLPIENEKVIIYELEIDGKSPILNKKLWEIGFPKESTIGCIIRREKTIIPQGNTELKSGDRVILLTNQDAIDKITLLFTGRHRKVHDAF